MENIEDYVIVVDKKYRFLTVIHHNESFKPEWRAKIDNNEVYLNSFKDYENDIKLMYEDSKLIKELRDTLEQAYKYFNNYIV